MAPSPNEIEIESAIDADSWAFALAIYAKPGVADACLALQNKAGVDVMLLLMTTFAAVRRRLPLSPDEIKALDEACRPWRERIVRPLRTIRSELKTGPRPAPRPETEAFRSTVKTVELAAERLQNQLLAACLPRRPAENAAVSSERLRMTLDCVVGLFAARQENPVPDLSTFLNTIVGAAIEDAS